MAIVMVELIICRKVERSSECYNLAINLRTWVYEAACERIRYGLEGAR